MIIETSQLRKSFTVRAGRQREIVEAVAGMDLKVKEGEIFGLLGPNGAGKTTTLNMLATLLPPDSGQAVISGADLLRDAAQVRRRLGYVGQQGGTTEDATGREELILQARLYGFSKAEAVRRAERLVADFQLGEFANRRCRTYSGGQRRRVDIAMGVIHNPAVVLLDEPSAGLDPASRAVLWDEIRRLRARATSVVVTTHYLDEADALCDRLAIIDRGVTVAEGTPEELKAQVAGDVITLRVADCAVANAAAETVSARAAGLLRAASRLAELAVVDEERLHVFADQGPIAIPQIIRTLEGGGLQVTALTLHQPSLDDVFLNKTGRSLREPAER